MTPAHTPLTSLRFDVLQHGWSVLEIGSTDDPIVISASYVFSDPCEDLMIFCERVLGRDFGATVRFWEEPDHSVLEFCSASGIPLIKLINEREHAQGTDKTVDVKTWSVVPGFFVALCIGEFKRLAFLSDHTEFAKNRAQFPWKAYHSLIKRWDDGMQLNHRARKQK